MPSKVTLWDHQVLHGDRILSRSISALWWEMRTGKTLTAIHGTRDGDRLIVCTKSTMYVWESDLHAYGETDVWVYHPKRWPDHRPKNIVVNYESVWRTDLLTYGWDSVIFDESHRLSNPKTKLWDHLYENMEYLSLSRRVLLSGTPCPEGWHQFVTQAIIAQGNFGGYREPYAALRNLFSYDEYRYRWVPNKGTKALAEGILHGVGHSMTQKEAGITTQKLYRTVEVPVGAHELKLWKEFVDGDGKEAEAVQWAQRAQQIASGRNADGYTEKSSKLDAVADYVQDMAEPCVILCHFTSSIRYLCACLEADGKRVGMMYGEDAGAEYRGKLVASLNRGELDVILANVAVAKVGMNLSRASVIIYAENSWSGEARIQSEERCTVKGKSAVEIVDFVSTSEDKDLGAIDQLVLDAVKDKKDFNAKVLKYI